MSCFVVNLSVCSFEHIKPELSHPPHLLERPLDDRGHREDVHVVLLRERARERALSRGRGPVDGDAQRREAATRQKVVGKSADMVNGALLPSKESLIRSGKV
jgi:hypothetical protein